MVNGGQVAAPLPAGLTGTAPAASFTSLPSPSIGICATISRLVGAAVWSALSVAEFSVGADCVQPATASNATAAAAAIACRVLSTPMFCPFPEAQSLYGEVQSLYRVEY
jgi:hypothetical protein